MIALLVEELRSRYKITAESADALSLVLSDQQQQALEYLHEDNIEDNTYTRTSSITYFICMMQNHIRCYLRYYLLCDDEVNLSLIHISEPTRRTPISYAVFCL